MTERRKRFVTTIPYPPTVNTYWHHNRSGRVFLSSEARRYKQSVAEILRSRGRLRRITGRVALRVEVFPPDHRVRDLDNVLKSILDALTYAGLWLDDSQVDDLHVVRRHIKTPAACLIRVQEIVQREEAS